MSELKSLVRGFENLLQAKKADEAKAHLRDLFSRIDNRASKGVLHKNAAARKKARLAKRLSALSKA